MKAAELTAKLRAMDACDTAIYWQTSKSLEEVWNTCPRGDWMIWLLNRTTLKGNPIMCLIAGHCANTVRHLMKDDRSIAAADAAIDYGEGRITRDELRYAAAAAAAAAAAFAAADAADAAGADADAAAAAAFAAADAADAADDAAFVAAADAARSSNRKKTADIVRNHISLELITKLLYEHN